VGADWRSAVEHYTRTRLTVEGDVFPAISGVVKDMQRYRADRYLAGVWEGSVLDDLAWQVARDGEPLLPRRRGVSLAPSWSWAAVKSPVSYKNYRTMLSDEYVQRLAPTAQPTQLVEASITPAGSDPTAALLAGELVLFSPVLAVRLEAEDGDDGLRVYYVQHNAKRLEFVPDYDLAAPGSSNVPAGSMVYLLFLCREPELKGGPGGGTNPQAFSLVLRRVDGEAASRRSQPRLDSDVAVLPEDGTYERIGLHSSELEMKKVRDYVEENGIECAMKLI
jgi:hypothetical protein